MISSKLLVNRTFKEYIFKLLILKLFRRHFINTYLSICTSEMKTLKKANNIFLKEPQNLQMDFETYPRKGESN